jgi:hypothetical protein
MKTKEQRCRHFNHVQSHQVVLLATLAVFVSASALGAATLDAEEEAAAVH